ncbi:SDR family oxidoreductase [Corynebacterium lowii]|uniref:3-alpha-(Or 20-beta)-hydroxysteroid dehydrogenase n=1 Tax=Corynebacterium lowii TaxID=1544413 RepID=A0A0Q0UFX9_9CORY|nr:SDR family oxidoreductase [Corynebacterium lowii]KQB87068.1 3-alpha-(or 20-beta)-hydroxysteroid dehydrogenase [Corynebacterium lowii]MDP9852348.1 NAD(P)-dependent dehydrogenase (short-subunit alcohol dehydrogenase family) [Corynebacterium lowii]
MSRSVFISGAARGIGRSTALHLARRGWTVGVYDILDDFGWITTENLGPGTIHHGYLDVTDPESWTKALEDFTSHTGGRLDALVNNAGVLHGGPFVEGGSYEKDSALVDVNVKGVFNGARAAYPYLKATPDSTLLNLASASAIYGTPDLAVYSASKFAVRGLTEALNVEWEPEGIKVRALWPLFVKTNLLDDFSATSTKRLGVRLKADDVAKAAADMVERERGKIAKVHQPVGLPAKVLYGLSQVCPSWMVRFGNGILTTNRKLKI